MSNVSGYPAYQGAAILLLIVMFAPVKIDCPWLFIPSMPVVTAAVTVVVAPFVNGGPKSPNRMLPYPPSPLRRP